MDISGPVRTFLRTRVASHPPATFSIDFFNQVLAYPEQRVAEPPPFLREKSESLGTYLELASALRIVPRIPRWDRPRAHEVLRPRFEAYLPAAEKILLERDTPSHVFLWHHYLLALARTRLDMAVPDELLNGLWRRAWGAWSRSPEPRPLHSLPQASTQPTIHLDLLAIHAAYGSVLLLQQHERLDPLEKLIQWHVRHTPPDDPEPWALAAFAFLDDTQTYALRQFDAASRSPAVSPMSLALLADALLTQEEPAG